MVERSLRAVEQGSKRMSRLVAQILDVSRLDGGRLVLAREDTDLAALVRGIVEGIQTTTSRHTLRVHAPATLPALVDPLRLEQVITNLLDNAIKFSPTGGTIEIDLAQSAPDMARLTVTDQGVGIPPERRQHIFERFYQAHDRDHVAGMGLGLYISRQIVDLHGGSIEPEFPLDGGCRFAIDLPTAPATVTVGERKEVAP
jgi:signal transduction histidine kinase